MEEMGIPEHMVQVIRSLYTNQEAKVRTEYGDTESFIHVNPERSFRGTNYGPSSEPRRALEGGSGGPPPEIFKNLYCKWCNLSYS